MCTRIAVASNDGVSISRHFGRTSHFAVFEIESHVILTEESRWATCCPNVMEHCEAEPAIPGQVHDYGPVVDVLRDCQTLLCGGMGRQAATALVRRGINPLVIAGDISPRVAVEHYMAGSLTPAPGFCRRHRQPAAGKQRTPSTEPSL